MQWKIHFRRIIFILLIASIVLASLVKLLNPPSGFKEFEARNMNGASFILEKGNALARTIHGDPCRQTPASEWATEEFGPQGCWVVQTYGEWGLRVLLTLKESEEFRKLFEDIGPNRLIPILGNTLSHPEDFKLFITEGKALDVAGAPMRAVKKRWDAGKKVITNGGTISDAARAAMQSSGVGQATLQNVKKEYTAEETLVLMLYLIEKGQGRFLDQFHLIRNDKGEIESVEVEYLKHGLHITTSFLSDGLTNFEKKYRWEQVTGSDVGWALLDVAFFVAPIYKVARIGKVIKATKATETIVTATTKASKIAKVAKVAKVAWFTATIGTGVYVVFHPWQVINTASDIGVSLLNRVIPEWLANLFGPFLGIFLAITFIYILAWPLIAGFRAMRRVIGVALSPFILTVRWLYPRRA